MLAIALGLTSSLCWGTGDFLGGLQARRIALLWLMLISQGASLAGLVLVLALRGHAPPSLAHLLPAIGGGIVGILGLAAFYRGLAIGRMSIVAPISATSAAIPVIVGIAGGESPGIGQVAGILIAIVGVVLVSQERDDPEAVQAKRVTRTAVLLALAASVGFGVFFVGLRDGARFDVLWALCAARGAAVLTLAVGVAASRPPVPRGGRTLGVITLVGTLDISANGLYALATRHGLLSVVAVVSSLYPLVTVVFARTLLREQVRRIQEVGIAAALAGVALMAAG